MRNGYSKDKIIEGGGEDQPGRLFLRALNCLTKKVDLSSYWARMLRSVKNVRSVDYKILPEYLPSR
jgi:hypothetical protein